MRDIGSGSRTHIAFTPATWNTVSQPRMPSTSASSSKRSPRIGSPPASLDDVCRLIGAGERPHLATICGQAAEKRTADEPTAPGQEGGTLHARLSLSSADQRPPNRAKYSTAEPIVTAAATSMAY